MASFFVDETLQLAASATLVPETRRGGDGRRAPSEREGRPGAGELVPKSDYAGRKGTTRYASVDSLPATESSDSTFPGCRP